MVRCVASGFVQLHCQIGQLLGMSSVVAYHMVMDAVACFEKGNEMLAEVLKEQE
jgi:hypothetical protein